MSFQCSTIDVRTTHAHVDRAEAAMPSFRACGVHAGDPQACTVPLWGAMTLLEGLLASGHSREEMLHRLGFASAEVDEQARVPMARFAAVLRWACRRSRDELAGLWLHPVPLGAFAMVVRQMQQCATLGEAVHLALRLYRMVAPGFPLRLRRDGLHAWFEIPRGHGSSLGFDLTCLYWLLSTIRWLTARHIPVRAACVSRDDMHPSYREPQPFLEVPFRYGAEVTGFAIDLAWLHRPIARGAADVQAFLRAAPANLMRSTSASASAVEQVRAHLEQQLRGGPLDNLPAFEAVARRLESSPRALRRRLHAEGVSFLKLRETCLRDMALQWVAHTELPLGDVGAQMGFSDSSTFHRAFKRWTGKAPGDYRRRMLLSAEATLARGIG